MNDIKPLLHEVLNALAIARGMTENVQMAISDEFNMPLDQQLDKINKALKAMDRIENATNNIENVLLKTKQV